MPGPRSPDQLPVAAPKETASPKVESRPIGQRAKEIIGKIKEKIGGSNSNSGAALAEIAALPSLEPSVAEIPVVATREPKLDKDTTQIEEQVVARVQKSIADHIAQDGDPHQVLEDIASKQEAETPQAVSEKPTTPKFIREFSKEHSAEERQQAARDIRATRREHFEQKKEISAQQTQLQEETGKKESALLEQRQRLEKLRDEVARLSGPWFSRLLHYTRLRGLNADLQTAEEAYQTLQQEETTLQVQEQTVGVEADKLKDAPKLEEGRQKIQSFYKNEKEKWASADYSKEDIARYFTEEHLASLPIEDYITLLRRFPSDMVTHVTRQGIVDHSGGFSYTSGLDRYTDGFTSMLKDGRLRSGIGALLQQGIKKGTVAEQWVISFKTKKKALENLNRMLDPQLQLEGRGNYAEFGSLHFATEEVVDNYYGAERGNEIFYVFPSVLIASEALPYSGLLTEAETRANSTLGLDNDVWVWAQDQKGIDVNAGIVFLPAEAKVDTKTGSKYEIDEYGKPILLQKNRDALLHFTNSSTFTKFSTQYLANTVTTRNSEESALVAESFKQQLATEYGISDTKLIEAILDRKSLSDINVTKKLIEDGIGSADALNLTVDSVLMEHDALFKETPNPISSREYWEGYFTNNPAQRPKHIVYYADNNPTKAFKRWREESGLSVRATHADFSESQPIREISPIIMHGSERFRSIAEEAIEDYFSQPKAA